MVCEHEFMNIAVLNTLLVIQHYCSNTRHNSIVYKVRKLIKGPLINKETIIVITISFTAKYS